MSVSDWKAREKEQRRNDIIDAAEKLFVSQGYDNVSMDDIAKEIKLGKATLYRYFNSKESVFFAAVLRGVRIQHAMTIEGLKKARTGAQRLAAIGNATFDLNEKYPQYNKLNNYYHSGRFARVLLADSGDAVSPSPAARVEPGSPGDAADREAIEEISRLRMDMFETSCRAIATGRQDGSIRPGMDPVRLAFLLSLFSGSLVNLSPMDRCLLEYTEIDHDQFIADARDFIHQNIYNK
jgi:TetR/AcrR family transcriptional regulator